MLLLLVNQPVWLVIIYAVAGAFFMPLLALLLLLMNNRRSWVGELRNGMGNQPAATVIAAGVWPVVVH